MNKYLKLFALAVGLTTMIAFVLILIFNTGFYVGITRFIPEGNNIIRFSEIGIGLLAIPLLVYMIVEEIKR